MLRRPTASAGWGKRGSGRDRGGPARRVTGVCGSGPRDDAGRVSRSPGGRGRDALAQRPVVQVDAGTAASMPSAGRFPVIRRCTRSIVPGAPSSPGTAPGRSAPGAARDERGDVHDLAPLGRHSQPAPVVQRAGGERRPVQRVAAVRPAACTWISGAWAEGRPRVAGARQCTASRAVTWRPVTQPSSAPSCGTGMLAGDHVAGDGRRPVRRAGFPGEPRRGGATSGCTKRSSPPPG